ncbi:hypothetical protein B0H14DRAFT_2579834 [Mycena olivaceomarginata]|nr:hypothetical protein B0H14DRAFT_2579834 [Mycena olivaceomarginata]
MSVQTLNYPLSSLSPDSRNIMDLSRAVLARKRSGFYTNETGLLRDTTALDIDWDIVGDAPCLSDNYPGPSFLGLNLQSHSPSSVCDFLPRVSSIKNSGILIFLRGSPRSGGELSSMFARVKRRASFLPDDPVVDMLLSESPSQSGSVLLQLVVRLSFMRRYFHLTGPLFGLPPDRHSTYRLSGFNRTQGDIIVRLVTGTTAGTTRPTRTRTRQNRTRRGSGTKPVRVNPRFLNHPRVPQPVRFTCGNQAENQCILRWVASEMEQAMAMREDVFDREEQKPRVHGSGGRVLRVPQPLNPYPYPPYAGYKPAARIRLYNIKGGQSLGDTFILDSWFRIEGV